MLGLRVKESERGRIGEILKGILPDTRAFPGCEGVIACQNIDDPADVRIIETWSSIAQYEEYVAWRTRENNAGSMGAALEESPTHVSFEVLDTA
jgi:quinol monooxygenase YgiN